MFYLFISQMQFPPFAGRNIFPRDLIQVLHRELRGPESEMKGFTGKQRNFRRLQEGGVLMCKNSQCKSACGRHGAERRLPSDTQRRFSPGLCETSGFICGSSSD